MSLVRSQYERIQDPRERGQLQSGAAPGYQYGSLYQASVQEGDPENPIGASDVRVTHHVYDSLDVDAGRNRRRMLWWTLAPALAILVVIGTVATMRTGNSKVSAPPMTGIKIAQPSGAPVTSPLPLLPVVTKDASTPFPPQGETTEPVMGCLEFKCRSLTIQLSQTWTDFNNISLMRCLAAANMNKTAAGTCFQTAGPSTLRDDLVACAGCNGCLNLKDQASIDTACDKYAAWSGAKPAPSVSVATPQASLSTPADDAKTKIDQTIDHVKERINNIIDSATGQANATKAHINDTRTQASDALTNATATAKANGTAVLTCLEDKCKPLTTQLVQAWKDLANIQLMRCLASAAVNKTAAADCFQSTHPSDLRDSLVACAGCNGCIKMKDQANIDKACAKYDAWKAKQAASPDAATSPAATSLEASVSRPSTLADVVSVLDHSGASVPGQEADARTSLTPDAMASLLGGTGLPKDLQAKYCSRYWCP